MPPRHRRPALAEGEVRLAHERLPFLGPAVDRVYTEPLLSLRAGLGASGTFVRSVDGEQVDAERVVAARCADLERGMAHQGYDLQLTRYDARGWRATFYTTGMEHRPRVRLAPRGNASRGTQSRGGAGGAAPKDHEHPLAQTCATLPQSAYQRWTAGARELYVTAKARRMIQWPRRYVLGHTARIGENRLDAVRPQRSPEWTHIKEQIAALTKSHSPKAQNLGARLSAPKTSVTTREIQNPTTGLYRARVNVNNPADG